MRATLDAGGDRASYGRFGEVNENTWRGFSILLMREMSLNGRTAQRIA
jgi:hypothetical protein